jgi:hypothetical protein
MFHVKHFGTIRAQNQTKTSLQAGDEPRFIPPRPARFGFRKI